MNKSSVAGRETDVADETNKIPTISRGCLIIAD